MKTLTIILRKSVSKGSSRPLTPFECNFIKDQNTSVRPYPGKNWSVARSDDGHLSLRVDRRDAGASWALEETQATPVVDPCDFPVDSAILAAERAADLYGIPQTVYSNATSGGWWHTSAVAQCLVGASVRVTMLPDRYFS